MFSFLLYFSFIYKYICSKVFENFRKEINFRKFFYLFFDIDFIYVLLIFVIINKLFLISCCGVGIVVDIEMII